MIKIIRNYLCRIWSRLFKKQEPIQEPIQELETEKAPESVYVKRNERGRVPKVLRRIRTMQGKSTGDY